MDLDRTLEFNDIKGVNGYYGRWNTFVLDVNTKLATFQGKKLRDMDDHFRKKFENLLVIASPDGRMPVVLYNGQRRHRHNPRLFDV